ncbi:hypothetical protein PPL_08750 [Heterostelium album PN500]|uniref:Uncharacterized protein n=1 Tax=Heterostelium pallidum (strain ATCC 26659 / Pp 5 / PN500) TaxID=670386 RepID=D3BJM2_HETP5|nr:hypothetical protein PPL_08750 [Heterostelium album PN500]EFA78102.1 hypothetical protein PPL_08750 [Heterostelium album PN500]|eukprot:XP_020430229.1 hypothetical protein PPL_08750 [Heterostelium album PN500]
MTKRTLESEEELKKLQDPTNTSVVEDDDESDDESDEESEDEEDGKAKKKAAKKPRKQSTPKKVARPTLKNVLSALTHPQLIKMVSIFIEEKHPELKDEFIDTVPPPSVEEIHAELTRLHNSIDRAWPNSKYGSGRDHFCYKRVAGHLRNYKAGGSSRCKLQASNHSTGRSSTTSIDDFPVFDDSKNNAGRAALFKKLSTHGKTALRYTTLTKPELDNVLTKVNKEATQLADLIKAFNEKK